MFFLSFSDFKTEYSKVSLLIFKMSLNFACALSNKLIDLFFVLDPTLFSIKELVSENFENSFLYLFLLLCKFRRFELFISNFSIGLVFLY